MVPKETFEPLRKELEAFDEQRETLIAAARKLNTLAKKGLYEAHRNDLPEATRTFAEAKPLAEELKAAYAKDYRLKFGAVTAALQEWAECLAYLTYAKEQRLLTKDETGLETEDYLLALADLSGEMARRAVLCSIEKKPEQVKAIRAFVDELLGGFLSFNFRNGELRKKTDSVRWNLQKIEELLVRQG